MAPELWGGVECTVSRVGEAYRDQLRLSGHGERPGDIALFAALGIRALRFPVLWERAEDAAWADVRLAQLRSYGIRPIVGLIHHGSGPRQTSLLSDDFAPGLAAHAAAVAARHPWIEAWTPVNEPVTTARFAGLYGHWYPHARDERSFWTALLNQVDATRLAMAAIRRVNPAAQLIQTDDLGHTYATPPLAAQAEHDNLRRWAGWDLLFGRIDAAHPLFPTLTALGLDDRVRAIADDPCPPAVVGVNHYLTSDRVLDDRLDRYPPHLHGGNGRQRYADTEAVRALETPPAGLAGALRAAWARYRTPLAVTEVHNGCTREEQLRWAAEAWDTAMALTNEGIDVRAVTAWSLLGSHDWDTLLTRDGGYESGVFDLANGTPRSTALAALWRGLPQGAARHPVADQPGWWRRNGAEPARPTRAAQTPPLLILGATGTLGQAFARACRARGIAHRLASRSVLDLADAGAIGATLDRLGPWGVVNAAGWVRVDDAEGADAACRAVNTDGAVALATACAERRLPCLNVSSDLVFAGDGGRPLIEADAPQPLGAYGRSKAAMEAGCAHLPGSLVVRTAAFFSEHDPHNFAAAVVRTLAAGGRFDAAGDHIVSPTYVPALVDRALDLLIDGAEGIWHLSGGEGTSWADFAGRVAAACGYDPSRVRAVPGAALGWRAPRPRYVSLTTTRGSAVPMLDDGIARFAHAHRREGRGG